MSDFVFAAGQTKRPSVQLLNRYLRVSDITNVQIFESESFHFSVARPGDQKLWAPLRDPDADIYFAVIGRPVSEFLVNFDEPGIDVSGGIRTRSLYQTYLREGFDVFSSLHGSFSILAYHARENRFFFTRTNSGFNRFSIASRQHPLPLAFPPIQIYWHDSVKLKPSICFRLRSSFAVDDACFRTHTFVIFVSSSLLLA